MNIVVSYTIIEEGDYKMANSTLNKLTQFKNQSTEIINAGADKARGLLGKSNLFAGKAIKLEDLHKDSVYKDKNSNKIFDVVDNYAWTLTEKANRSSVPYIEMIEYEQDVSTLYAQLVYWSNNLKISDGSSINPYENLYHALPTGTRFILPYFEQYDHNIGQAWEKTKGIADFAVIDKLLQVAGNVAKALQLAPGTTVNQPQVWKGPSNANTYTISFKLFNTNDELDIAKNQVLKRRLQMSTLHDQRSAILSSPPAIFEVNIPGIRYSPAAVISQLTVSNLGQMNNIKGENIPDAYEFNIQILELITESRQILNASVHNDFAKVKAITDKTQPATDKSKNSIEISNLPASDSTTQKA